ncbi:MAG TPA: hypothetical protein VGI43_12650 [Mucilaginibacter sp.]|jgi:hypothetical protein
MIKPLLSTIILLLLAQFSNAQTDTVKKEFYNAEFKWKIVIPGGFDTVSATQYSGLQKIGTEEMEKTADTKFENQIKRICAFKSDIFNYFEANEQPLDTIIDGNYLAHCKYSYNLIYDTYKRWVPNNATIDTTSSKIIVDGLDFECFKVLITMPNKMTINMLVYSKLFEKKEFTVVMVYVNKQKGEKLLAAWRDSKFKKD